MANVLTSIYFKLVLVAFLWGGTFIAGRVLAETIPPIISATARFLIASVLLLLWLYKKEGKFPRLNFRQGLFTLAAGITGIFLYNIFFFGALTEIPAGRTALLVSLNPIFTSLFLFIFFKERMGAIGWLGIVLAFLGVSIIVTRGDIIQSYRDISSALGTGELLMLGAVVSWSAYTILGRFTLRSLSPLAATTYATCVGFVLLLCASLFYHSDLTRDAFTDMLISKNMFAVLYLSAFGTVLGFVWYYQGVSAIGASRAAIFTNLVPVFGVLLGYILLDEPMLLSMKYMA